MPENKLKKIFASRAALFLLLLAFVWLSLVLVKAVYKKKQLDREIENIKAEIDKTEKKNDELSRLLNYFGSDIYLEKEAKDKLNLKKEGENVVLIQGIGREQTLPARDGGVRPSPESSTGAPAKENNLIRWWNFFFKR